MSLEKKLNQNLTQAVAALVLVSFMANGTLFYYEIQGLTDSIIGSFVSQVNNVARVASQSGDILSLQKNLESVAEPLAKNFPIELAITRKTDNRVFVFIEPEKTGRIKVFTKEFGSNLEVNPFGAFEVKIVFDLTLVILIVAAKAILATSILLLALILVRRYIRRVNKKNLNPVDQFYVCLDKIPASEFLDAQSDKQVDGLSDELRSGFSKLLVKMRAMSGELASLESQRRVNEIARRLAHDIRSPLSALNSLVFSISEINDDHKKIIEQVSKRITAIANDMLASTKISSVGVNSSERLPLLKGTPSKIELKKFLERTIVEKKMEYLEDPRVVLDGHLERLSSEVKIAIADDVLSRVISNLVNNAVEAIGEDGLITIEAWTRRGMVYVKVQDSGVGIPESVLSRLTTEQVSTKVAGSGIGVLSSFEVIRANAGQLQIQSKVGVGTQVILIFEIAS